MIEASRRAEHEEKSLFGGFLSDERTSVCSLPQADVPLDPAAFGAGITVSSDWRSALISSNDFDPGVHVIRTCGRGRGCLRVEFRVEGCSWMSFGPS